jgi:O-antigen/teichoic acid export membrane protein
MSLKKEISFATYANWTGTFFSYLIALVATPIIVHSFGNTRYGIWSIAMSITGYYGILEIGIRTTVIKYIAEYAEKKDYKAINVLLNTSLSTYAYIIPLIALAITVLVVNVDRIFNIAPQHVDETKILFVIVGMNFCIDILANPFRGIIVGLRRFDIRNGIEIVFSILRSVCLITILKLGYGLIAAALGVTAVVLLKNMTFLGYVFRLCPYLRLSRKYIDFLEMKGAYVFAFFNFLRQISIRVIERTPIILIGIMFDMKMAAFYSIAESLTHYLIKIPKGLRATLLPFSSKLNAGGREEDLQKMAMLFPKYTISFFFGVHLLASLFGRQFLNLWLGSGYDLSFGILQILLLATAFTTSQSMFVHIVIGMGHNRFYGILGFFEMVLTLSSCIILAKLYGLYGIAFGSLASALIISGLFVPIYSTKKIGLGVTRYYMQTIFIPALISLFLYAVNAVIFHIESPLWLPVIAVEFITLNYIFVWKEIRFRKGLKIRI